MEKLRKVGCLYGKPVFGTDNKLLPNGTLLANIKSDGTNDISISIKGEENKKLEVPCKIDLRKYIVELGQSDEIKIIDTTVEILEDTLIDLCIFKVKLSDIDPEFSQFTNNANMMVEISAPNSDINISSDATFKVHNQYVYFSPLGIFSSPLLITPELLEAYANGIDMTLYI